MSDRTITNAVQATTGSDLFLTPDTGYVRTQARKVSTKSALFFHAQLLAPQAWTAPTGVVIFDTVDPRSDAVIAPAPPPTPTGFSYDAVTGIITCVEPGEPNEYLVTVGVPLSIAAGNATYQLFLMFGAGPPTAVLPQDFKRVVATFSPTVFKISARVGMASGDNLFVQCDSAAANSTFLAGASINVQRIGDGG